MRLKENRIFEELLIKNLGVLFDTLTGLLYNTSRQLNNWDFKEKRKTLFKRHFTFETYKICTTSITVIVITIFSPTTNENNSSLKMTVYRFGIEIKAFWFNKRAALAYLLDMKSQIHANSNICHCIYCGK